MTTDRSTVFAGAFAIIVAAAYPLLIVSPNAYLVFPISLTAPLALVAIGQDLIYGVADQLTMAQAAFFGIGSYAFALMFNELGLRPELCVIIVIFEAAALAALFGAVLLKLSGFYFAVGTLGIAIVFGSLLIALSDLTGGENGMGVYTDSMLFIRPENPAALYYFLWAVTFLFAFASLKLVRSPWVLIARASGSDATMLRAQGRSPWATKLLLFTLGSCLASLGGALYAFGNGYIAPSSADLTLALDAIIAVIIGRRGTIFGPLVAMTVVSILPVILGDTFQRYVALAYGVLLIIATLKVPSAVARLRRSRTGSPSQLGLSTATGEAGRSRV